MDPADAMWYWLATRFPTDQFIVFAFAGKPESPVAAAESAMERARANPFLTLRIIDDPPRWRLPRWVSGGVESDRCTVHDLADPTWTGFLEALAGLVSRPLALDEHTWRLHVFSPLQGVPGSPDVATVVVMQITHALGDGPRSAALAGYLFGRDAIPADAPYAPDDGLVRRVATALRERRAFEREVAGGRIPAARPEVSPLSTNTAPTGDRVLRTLVRPASSLPGPTPTVGALVAVSEALSGYLRARGEDAAHLSAGVPVARSGAAYGFNHIDTAIVGLHPDARSRDERIRLIAGDLIANRRRQVHPASPAKERVLASVPAPIRKWGISRADFTTAPATVPGHTVVSTVDRGAADLDFGGCPVLFTAGYPMLLPICNLVHGVHRIGDTAAISVHTTSATDVDDYLDRLAAVLDG